jgi:hypothetical protein
MRETVHYVPSVYATLGPLRPVTAPELEDLIDIVRGLLFTYDSPEEQRERIQATQIFLNRLKEPHLSKIEWRIPTQTDGVRFSGLNAEVDRLWNLDLPGGSNPEWRILSSTPMMVVKRAVELYLGVRKTLAVQTELQNFLAGYDGDDLQMAEIRNISARTASTIGNITTRFDADLLIVPPEYRRLEAGRAIGKQLCDFLGRPMSLTYSAFPALPESE